MSPIPSEVEGERMDWTGRMRLADCLSRTNARRVPQLNWDHSKKKKKKGTLFPKSTQHKKKKHARLWPILS